MSCVTSNSKSTSNLSEVSITQLLATLLTLLSCVTAHFSNSLSMVSISYWLKVSLHMISPILWVVVLRKSTASGVLSKRNTTVNFSSLYYIRKILKFKAIPISGDSTYFLRDIIDFDMARFIYVISKVT